MQKKEILDLLIESISEGDQIQAVDSINKALQAKLGYKKILEEGIIKGAEKVGKLYEKSEIYLPELILAADAMMAAIEVLKPHFEQSIEKSSKGTILIGTPEGDIHSIGKNVIISLLQGQGYDVLDLGTDIPPIEFVNKAKKIKPDVIGLSGLMTTTITKMQETIILLKEENISAKIILGGGVVTEESCKMVGADDFATDGWDGIKKIKKLLELNTERF
jgi:methylmalonyl-CoA mutase cobalamin-binding domain/chain